MAHVWTSHITLVYKSCPMSHVAHMNESYCTYEWVMSQIGLCWMSYMALLDGRPRHPWMWHVTPWMWHVQCVTSHMSMSHIAHTNESCRTNGSGCCSSTTLVNESCHTYHRVTSRLSMSHVAHNESCCTYEWVMSHIRISHFAQMIPGVAVHDTCQSVMLHVSTSHVTPTNESRYT